MASLPLPRSN